MSEEAKGMRPHQEVLYRAAIQEFKRALKRMTFEEGWPVELRLERVDEGETHAIRVVCHVDIPDEMFAIQRIKTKPSLVSAYSKAIAAANAGQPYWTVRDEYYQCPQCKAELEEIVDVGGRNGYRYACNGRHAEPSDG